MSILFIYNLTVMLHSFGDLSIYLFIALLVDDILQEYNI